MGKIGFIVVALLLVSPCANAELITVGTDFDTWRQSTQRADGSNTNTWTHLLTGSQLPDASTFTLVPQVATFGGPTNSGTALGDVFNLDGGNGNPTGVQFFRTQIDLTGRLVNSASLTISVDNNAQIFINRQELARELNFDATPWENPLPTATFLDDGTTTNVNKFDSVFGFTDWNNGLNEVIIAARNPNAEANNAGSFAFSITLDTAMVPEPSACLLFAVPALAIGMRRRRRDW